MTGGSASVMLKEPYILEKIDGHLQIRRSDSPKLGPIFVDFCAGKSRFRRLFGGGRKQALARASGLRKGTTPFIVDATAGLGREACILASLGCRVHMIERIPEIAAMLEDGLRRAAEDAEIGPWISERLTVQSGDSRTCLLSVDRRPDVVYLDPMYPESGKAALVKKEMRIFRDIVGADDDAEELLSVAIGTARDRVVVKRPDRAGYLGGVKPDTSIRTRKHRFDIYLSKNRQS